MAKPSSCPCKTCTTCQHSPCWRCFLTNPRSYVAVVAILAFWWLLTAATLAAGE